MPEPRTVLTEIMQKGCWIWSGRTNEDGYGVLYDGRRQTRAHRLAWENINGETDLVLHHLCGEKRCFNPSHLLPVGRLAHDYLHNGMASHNASKTHCRLGHPYEGDNLKVITWGKRRSRRCRICCNAAWMRRYRMARMEEAK